VFGLGMCAGRSAARSHAGTGKRCEEQEVRSALICEVSEHVC
jgi:hypothetical protein